MLEFKIRGSDDKGAEGGFCCSDSNMIFILTMVMFARCDLFGKIHTHTRTHAHTQFIV